MPKGGEYCIILVDTEHPRMLSCGIISEEVGSQDIVLSCEDGFLLHT
jgi:hypothetical protein